MKKIKYLLSVCFLAMLASSAFLTVARPGDNPQKPSINIIYNQMDKKTNAVDALRKKFNVWKGKG